MVMAWKLTSLAFSLTPLSTILLSALIEYFKIKMIFVSCRRVRVEEQTRHQQDQGQTSTGQGPPMGSTEYYHEVIRLIASWYYIQSQGSSMGNTKYCIQSQNIPGKPWVLYTKSKHPWETMSIIYKSKHPWETMSIICNVKISMGNHEYYIQSQCPPFGNPEYKVKVCLWEALSIKLRSTFSMFRKTWVQSHSPPLGSPEYKVMVHLWKALSTKSRSAFGKHEYKVTVRLWEAWAQSHSLPMGSPEYKVTVHLWEAWVQSHSPPLGSMSTKSRSTYVKPWVQSHGPPMGSPEYKVMVHLWEAWVQSQGLPLGSPEYKVKVCLGKPWV